MVTITYFVHGTTTDNETDIATGWLDGELSQKGIAQSEDLHKLLEDQHFDVIIASDLARAVASARIFFGPDATILEDPRLREANYGDLNGTPNTFKDQLADYIENPFPNGESYEDVEARIRSLCTSLRAQYDGKHVALVAHQGPQLALDVVLRGKTWQEAILEDWRHTKAYQPGWHYTIQ